MKLAATHAIARLTRLPVPEEVKNAYNDPTMAFGRNYILPKPMDPRLLGEVAPAVARAAIESGVSRRPITDWQKYTDFLAQLSHQCSDGVCYSQLLNSRETLERIAARLGYHLT